VKTTSFLIPIANNTIKRDIDLQMNSDLYTFTTMSSTRKSKQPIASISASDIPKTSPPKPMRPLTAYHIFFQIEREYIIQTALGASSDLSIHKNKSYQPNVPSRYAKIKLSNDWFAGPGKRAKRKHRKSHGCIGFLELSRVISQRWAELGDIDPETKAFVSGIAKREFDMYKREMKEYEALVGSSEVNAAAVKPIKSAPVKKSKRGAKKASAAASRLPALPTVTSSCERSGTLVTPPATPPPSEEFFASEFDINVFVDILPDAAFSNMEDVDYSISFMDNAGHHIPSPAGSVCDERKRSFSEESICDPLFELDLPLESYFENSPKRRRMSVDAVDFMNMW
jgi:hypothetical protein